MGDLMDNIDKIKVLSAKINAIEIGLEWLAENNSTGPIPNGKMSTEQQISDLISQKNALQQEVDRLNNI
jgi:hypothetical protein